MAMVWQLLLFAIYHSRLTGFKHLMPILEPYTPKPLNPKALVRPATADTFILRGLTTISLTCVPCGSWRIWYIGLMPVVHFMSK